MGGRSSKSSSYDNEPTISCFRVNSITNQSIYNIIRNYNIDDDAVTLLREAALAIDDFDSYRDNMKIRAYADNDTYVIIAGAGRNVLDVRRDGYDNINCKWTGYSFGARVFKVWVPRLVSFLGKAVRVFLPIAGGVGMKAIGF